MRPAFTLVAYGALVYVVLVAILHLVVAISASWHAFRARSVRGRSSPTASGPPVSVIIAATEDPPSAIGDTLDAIMSQDYPLFEAILVSNGPALPATAEAIARFHAAPIDLIYRPMIPTGRVTACSHGSAPPHLIVIEKEPGSPADALNAGVNAARSPYVCLVEPGTRLERGALTRFMAAVRDDPERIVAVSGIDRTVAASAVARRSNPVSVLQGLEARRAAVTSAGLGSWAGLLTSSDGCVLVQKKALIRVGGFDSGAGGERTDLLFRLRSVLGGLGLSRRTVFIPEPLTSTLRGQEAGLASRLARARLRAELGCALVHLRPAGREPLRSIGLRLLAVGRVLTLLAPILDVAGGLVVTIGYEQQLIDFSTLAIFWTALLVGRTAYSCAAVLFDDVLAAGASAWRELAALFLGSLWEPLVARPRIAWWTCRACWQIVGGWFSLDRTRGPREHPLAQLP